jgi:tetratricopeptide (TPR) repeat protein
MARAAFGDLVSQQRENPQAHVGLATACVLQFETTRTEAEPERTALDAAYEHAREACRLDPDYGEAWATLGVVLDRLARPGAAGSNANAPTRDDSLSAHRTSVLLEPERWQHHLRFAAASWGEERMREARRTLQLQPGLPMAHWLAATVLVARQRLDDAQYELEAGLAYYGSEHDVAERLNTPGLHWLLGSVLLARGQDDAAIEAFGREVQQEDSGHLYAREFSAHAWYAIGAMRLRGGNRDAARAAFQECLRRVGTHPLASAALGLGPSAAVQSALDRATAEAVRLASRPGGTDADLYLPDIQRALADAPPGSAGWQLPIEPVLRPNRGEMRWAQILARLNARAR